MAVEKPVLTQEQQDAVAALASTNVYAKQSKFKTFRELPPKDKWPYFKQNFLTDVLIIIAVVGLVLAFVISYVTKGPEAKLSLEGVDMAEYSEQIDALGADFVKTQGIEDERLVRTDASIAIGENAAQDGSASLTARVSAGQINMIVAETDIFAEVNDRGDITKPAEVMSAADLEQVKDALVDVKGNPVSDVNDAVRAIFVRFAECACDSCDDCTFALPKCICRNPVAERFLNTCRHACTLCPVFRLS